MNKEICICASILMPDGYIVNGHRHCDAIHAALGIPRYTKDDVCNAEQGFTTSANRFVTREEGRKLQDAAGIPSKDPHGYMPNTLFSEDLY